MLRQNNKFSIIVKSKFIYFIGGIKMKKFFSFLICVCMMFSLMTGIVLASEKEEIVILYENDVHCAVEGYSKISRMKKELSEKYKYVGVVSSGDFVQGGSLGAVSKGEYIVNLMNMVGYDAIAAGNHEFDYHIDHLLYLADKMETKPVCCNFKKINAADTMFEPYKIVSYGDTDIAYIGITTPYTISSQFMNEKGEYEYTFCGNELYETVQESIDSAKKDGADIIIAVSHLGYDDINEVIDKWSVQSLIANTEGLDVILDGHSHSVIEGMEIADKGGKNVIVTSTGTKFEHIGKMIISSEGRISTELIKTADYGKTDEKVDEYLAKINEEYGVIGERKIGVSEVYLITHDEEGNRIIRSEETNLGDFCADAYRLVTGADIGYINGGGIRAEIDAGDITFNDVLSVFPFDNVVCTAEVKGESIRDMMENALRFYPGEDGSFPHISGIRFDLNESIPSSVKTDENDVFIEVEDAYRVSNIEILNKETDEYEPIDYEKTYILASHNYMLMDQGSGMSMLEDAKILINDGMLDEELLEKYVSENLGGVIGEEYKEAQGRINVISHEYVPLRKSFEEKGYEVIWTKLEPKKAVVKNTDCTYIFESGEAGVTVNGRALELSKAVYMENGITYIPKEALNLCSNH